MDSNSVRESIKVICRIKPEDKKTIKQCIFGKDDNSIKSIVENEKRDSEVNEFKFDRVFDIDANQKEIFDFCAVPIINGAMSGYNGTIFCYGQTSSGKTFTMEGITKDNTLKGIIPRAIEYIFETLENFSEEFEFSIKCSFIEIYMEKIQDLLDISKKNLLIKEDKENGIFVQDCTEIYVTSIEEMFHVFTIGTNNRKVGYTNMNSNSSRSHSIFLVSIKQKNTKLDSIKNGKLYFVDLAGSERLSKTGVEGVGLDEAKNINKSLLALGNCINSLTEGKFASYRDSKLTRILQESLGGNSLTTLIITVSMNSYNDRESLSTLRFGSRAKTIKNKIKLNSEKSIKEYKIIIADLEKKILEFSTQKGSTFKEIAPIVEIDQNKISTDCKRCNDNLFALTNQHIEISNLNEIIENLTLDKEELENELQIRNNEIYELNERNRELQAEKNINMEENLILINNLENQISILKKAMHDLDKSLLRNKDDKEKLKKEIHSFIKKKLTLNSKNIYKSLSNNILDLKNIILNQITFDGIFAQINSLLEKKKNEYEIDSNLYNDINSFRNDSINNEDSSDNSLNDLSIKSHNNRSFGYFKKKEVTQDNEFNNMSFDNINLKRINKFRKFNIEEPLKDKVKLLSNDKIEAKFEFKTNLSNNPYETYYEDHNSFICNKLKTYKAKEYSKFFDLLSTVKPYINSSEIDSRHSNIKYLEFEYPINKFTINLPEIKKQEINDKSLEEKLEKKVVKLNELIKVAETKVNNLEKELQSQLEKSCSDLLEKENKLLNMAYKLSELEDDNYKLQNLIKDKDKKKYILVEKKCKELTKKLQSNEEESKIIKEVLLCKESQLKLFQDKITELSNKNISLVKKMTEMKEYYTNLLKSKHNTTKIININSLNNYNQNQNSSSKIQTSVSGNSGTYQPVFERNYINKFSSALSIKGKNNLDNFHNYSSSYATNKPVYFSYKSKKKISKNISNEPIFIKGGSSNKKVRKSNLSNASEFSASSSGVENSNNKKNKYDFCGKLLTLEEENYTNTTLTTRENNEKFTFDKIKEQMLNFEIEGADKEDSNYNTVSDFSIKDGNKKELKSNSKSVRKFKNLDLVTKMISENSSKKKTGSLWAKLSNIIN